jgi:hypothetical protein
MCVPSHPQPRRFPRSPLHRARRRRHHFLTWRSRRHHTPPLTPRSQHFRRHLIPASTRHHQFPKPTLSHISPLRLLPRVCTSILRWPRQPCNTMYVTTTPSTTYRYPQLFLRSRPPARLGSPYTFALLASPGNAPFGRTRRYRLGVPSSLSKTFLFACTTISAPKLRPTSTTLWARLGRRKSSRRSSGALGMTLFSAGKASDVWTFWAAMLWHRALRVLSRRRKSGRLFSVESTHRYHHLHHHHYQQPEAEKEEVYYLLFANKPWSGDAQRSTVILSTSFTSALHHNPPTHQKLTSYIHPPSVHYPLHHIFRPPFLTRSWTHSPHFCFLFFSIRNTIRLFMLPSHSFRLTLLTCCRLAILKHDLRIVLRTLFLDLGRFARSIPSFTLGFGILLRTPLRINIINISTHTNIIDWVVRSNAPSRTKQCKRKNNVKINWGTEQQHKHLGKEFPPPNMVFP